MAIRPDYDIGTVTLVASSANFTTTGASLQTAAVQAGDAIITPSGHVLIIASITGQNSGTLFLPCPAGAAGTNLPLRIRFQPDGSRYQGAVRNLVDLLSSGNLEAFAALVGSDGLVPIFTGIGTMDLADPATFGIQDPSGTLAKVADFPDAQDLGGKLLGLKDNAAGRVLARQYIRAATGELRNLIINPLFSINQRAVSGTVALSSGQFGHDRMKAGAGGCTYTFSTNNGVTTLNIISGSIFQIIEASSFAGRAGLYLLSWEGTSQGRILSGPYGTSGNVSAICDGSSNVSVEFNTGTLSLAQFEREYVTDFCTRHVQQEIDFCQRYWQRVVVTFIGSASNGVQYNTRTRLVPEMRIIPGLSATPGGVVGFPSGAPSVLAASTDTLVVGAIANATNAGGTFTYTVTCNAEI